MGLFLNFLSESAEVGVIDRLQAYNATAQQSIAQQQVSDPDYWSSVGIITLTGILVVFLILAILIFFFWLLGVAFKAVDKKKKSKAEKKTEAVNVEKAVEVPAAEEYDEQDDEELIAVISAAIAAYSENEGFTIRSVRKHEGKRTRSAWSAAGISENTRPF